ncbi:MAG: hypothetical protein JWQ01_4817 [Massilia sp.]|nr:hypothetical protein [Massilia sp.]
MNLDEIGDVVLLARGKYSTVRGAHEDAKKSLQMLCGQLSTAAVKVLRRMQPDNDDVPDSVDDLLSDARSTIVLMEKCVTEIESLAQQRSDLKAQAWGGKPKSRQTAPDACAAVEATITAPDWRSQFTTQQ